MKQILAILLLSCSVALSGCGKHAAPQEEPPEYPPVRLVMMVNGTASAVDTLTAKKLSDLMKEATHDSVQITVLSNDQLAGGDATKGIEMIADGTVDMAAYSASVMSVLDPKLSIASIPWTFYDYREARRVIDSTGSFYYTKRLGRQGLTYLGSVHNGLRQITNNKRPVKAPEDMAGLKIRVPGGQVNTEFIRSLGAEPVLLSASETTSAIQQNVADGQENSLSVIDSARIYELQPYMTMLNYSYENYLLVINDNTMRHLDPKTQQLLREKAKEACEWGRDMVEQNEQKLREKFERHGVVITDLEEAQLDRFRQVTEALREKLKSEYGWEACAAFQISWNNELRR